MEDKKADEVITIKKEERKLESQIGRLKSWSKKRLERLEMMEIEPALIGPSISETLLLDSVIMMRATDRLRELKERRIKLEFENNLGAELYNLHAQVFTQYLSEKELEKFGRDLADFCGRHFLGPDPLASLGVNINPNEVTQQEAMDQMKQALERYKTAVHSQVSTFITTLVEELPKYKLLVDKAMNRKEPTDEDINIVDERKKAITSTRWIDGTLKEMPAVGVGSIIGHAYGFLYRLWSGEVEVGRCAAEDCNNIFVPYKSGKEQRFCSARCRSRIHKRKKMASVDV